MTGREATDTDRTPISVGDKLIENVSEFLYLGSVISPSGRMQADIDKRIAQASLKSVQSTQCSATEICKWRSNAKCIKPVFFPPHYMELRAGHRAEET